MELKLVLIEWVDSHSGNDWRRLEEIEANGDPVHCRSVGWLVAEGRGCKTLVPHISGEKNNNVVPYGTGDISIPDAAITKLTILSDG